MVLGHFEGPGLRQPWWTTALAYLPWGPVSAYGELRYINPQTDKWGVGNSDIWSEDGASGLNLTLARCEAAAGGEPLLLAVRKTGARAIASRIDKKAAQELMNHIRMEAGKPVRIVFRDVDFSHSKAFLPISVLPSQVASTIDALSWPYSHSKDSGARLFRRETVGPVRRLLESYDITTKEIRIGDDSDDHREQR